MKIICTQDEKDLLLMIIADSENFCLFNMNCEIDCAKCCEKRIEWEIVENVS